VEDESNIAQAEYTPISFPISSDDHLFPLSSQQKTRKRKRNTQTDSHPAHRSATRSRSSSDPPSHPEAVHIVPEEAEAGRTVPEEVDRTAAEEAGAVRTAAEEAGRIGPEEDPRVVEAVHTALVEAARIVLVGAGHNLQEPE
jgi:hypothetical protein